MSIRPGNSVTPGNSITSAAEGTCVEARGPTAVMTPSWITMAGSWIIRPEVTSSSRSAVT